MRDHLSKIRFSPRASMRQQLSHQLREMIRSGEMSEGDRVPSNQALAAKWQVAASSVQAVMSSLVKEGLLQRARKRGTFVAKRSAGLTHVAIYLAEDIWKMRTAAFRRSMVESLSNQLRERKIQPVVWSDSRAASRQNEPWPELVRAAEQRQIQAVILGSGSSAKHSWLWRLPVPLVAMTHLRNHNCITYDTSRGERLAVEELAKKKCRSAGIITPTPPDAPAHLPEQLRSTAAFRAAAKERSLETRTEWIQFPDGGAIDEAEGEMFGYERMKKLLSMPERPDGIFVTHDWVARGALMAVLESRITVPRQLKLVLHRNVEIGLLCPVKASFLDFSVDAVAREMIWLMDAQLRGEKHEVIRISPVISAS